MSTRIALAGNPNCGKTTLFNALTGSNQFVGNWPGVTVEKKEGKLKGHKDVIITDLPGIYSLSSYTLEEVVARDYLMEERPDVILNIIDGSNLERNLYLTTQLIELGIPVVIAINMMDVVEKNGDKINTKELSNQLGCPVYEISAIKNTGVNEVAKATIEQVEVKQIRAEHTFSGTVEHALAHIEEAAVHNMPEDRQRWYAIKIFERDPKVLEALQLSQAKLSHIEEDIKTVENELDDDAESIITNERYVYIGEVVKSCYKKKSTGKLSTSDKIDKIVTNRWLGLPIFALVMFLIYYISMVTVGLSATDWVNDNLFGDGWYALGQGSTAYEEASEEYTDAINVIDAFIGLDEDSNLDSVKEAASEVASGTSVEYILQDEETLAEETVNYEYEDLEKALEIYEKYGGEEPAHAAYGPWIDGIPVLIENGLDSIGCDDVVKGLVLDGIVAGVGAVLGFVPQMLVLFLLLAFVEACGYMARIAFVLDRVFRRFGLSGKSFIPILIGTGCGVPGIMASRTIENENDRRMTIITTTFIPCSAKTPFIAMIAGAIFGGSPIIATSAYFLGLASIIISGLILKRTKYFKGDAAPFVMELPAYHWPTTSNVLRSMWERGWSFIKKAGTIILLSTIVIWFTTYFGFTPDGFRMLAEEEIDMSILASIGGALSWIFAPLGWGNWQATVASITGLVAKENIVGTMGILYGGAGSVYGNLATAFTTVSGYSFLAFNLLCAPCFAAMGAIKREMNSAKWTFFAIGYQCAYAYVIALIVTLVGNMITGAGISLGTWVVSAVLLALVIGIICNLIKQKKKGVCTGNCSSCGCGCGK